MNMRRLEVWAIGLVAWFTCYALSPQEIAEKALESVVVITATVGDETTTGTGFLVDDRGTVVTALHVIERAESLTVTFEDESRVEDVVVRAFDVENDLVVLGLEMDESIGEMVPLALGDTESVVRGARIVTIGNPMGLDRTLSEGIVSAWRAPEEDDSQEIFGSLPPTRLLQISASIFPGSSGGPVLNDDAEVIGIVSSGVLFGTRSRCRRRRKELRPRCSKPSRRGSPMLPSLNRDAVGGLTLYIQHESPGKDREPN